MSHRVLHQSRQPLHQPHGRSCSGGVVGAFPDSTLQGASSHASKLLILMVVALSTFVTTMIVQPASASTTDAAQTMPNAYAMSVSGLRTRDAAAPDPAVRTRPATRAVASGSVDGDGDGDGDGGVGSWIFAGSIAAMATIAALAVWQIRRNRH